MFGDGFSGRLGYHHTGRPRLGRFRPNAARFAGARSQADQRAVELHPARVGIADLGGEPARERRGFSRFQLTPPSCWRQ